MAGVITAHSPRAGSFGRLANHTTVRRSGCAVDHARHPHSADPGALLRTHAPELWLHEPWQQANTRLAVRRMVFRQFCVYAGYLRPCCISFGKPGSTRRQLVLVRAQVGWASLVTRYRMHRQPMWGLIWLRPYSRSPRSGGGGRWSGRRRSTALAMIAIGAVASAVLVVGCAGTGGSSAASPPQITNARWLLVPARGALLGAWVEPTGGATASNEEAAVAGFEHLIGRRLAIDNLYTNWAAPMPLNAARWDLRHGIVPMISWGGAQTSRIAEGADDAQIRARALQLRALHGPVMLRWFWEMDTPANAAIAGSPASFIAAWRHIYRVFAQVGATNVRWVWCPTTWGFGNGLAERFYPGSAYVDWIGADGYNWAPVRQVPWRTFAQIFSAFYKWGASTGKPLLVGEFGVLERAPGQKAAWFAQAERQLQMQLPAIRAVVYFNSYRKNITFDKYFDWKVTTSKSSLAAFRAFANNPYFNVRPST